VLRHAEAPTETYILSSANPPSGVDEPGTPVVANALLALGVPPTTSLPVREGVNRFGAFCGAELTGQVAKQWDRRAWTATLALYAEALEMGVGEGVSPRGR
jgi:hypothetical protein